MTERLTTLAAVKEWVGIDTTGSDDLLTRAIDAVSQFILQFLNRDPLGRMVYTTNFKGNGKSNMLLRNWPVIEILSLGVGGTQIFASSDEGFGRMSRGYSLDDTGSYQASIELTHDHFYYRAPCQVVYAAGYQTSDTFILTVPTPTVDPTWVSSKVWIGGISVGDANGSYTQVDSDPTTGQYAVDDWGVHTFSYLDEGASITVTYSYVPDDISFAACETVGQWFRSKEHIGLMSKSVGGQETISYTMQDLSPTSKAILHNYSDVVPL